MCVGYNLYYNYHIAGDFREFHGFVAIRSAKFGGGDVLWRSTASNPRKFSPSKVSYYTVSYTLCSSKKLHYTQPGMKKKYQGSLV